MASMLPPVVAGLLVTIFFGFGIKPFIKYASSTIRLDPPKGLSEDQSEQWANLMKGNEGGAILGWLERFIFFAAFLSQAYVVIAGWLAFKVASKWNVWSNIISVPKELKDIDEIDYLVARRRWGSHLLMTFQIGVAYNIIAALLGAAIALHWDKIIEALRSL